MGGCLSLLTGGSDEDLVLNRDLEVENQEKQTRIRTKRVKVLLLGSGDSGKSTILKQLRVILGMSFSPSEVEQYRQVIFDNLTCGIQYVLKTMKGMELVLESENLQCAEIVQNAIGIQGCGDPYPSQYREPLRCLWSDPNLQTALQRGNEVALPENLLYFFNDLDRFFHPEYTPTIEDIVQSRFGTCGIREMTFRLKELEMLIVDVGGRKSERRKWIHCFQNVTAILFVVSLSGYDQCLVEERDTNQLQDALTIWDSVSHSQWFEKTSTILFLNKNDLFEKKVQVSHIRDYFSDFEGSDRDAKAGRDYIKRRFIRMAGRAKAKDIYVHVTNATDTALLQKVMSAIEDVICRNHLENAALI